MGLGLLLPFMLQGHIAHRRDGRCICERSTCTVYNGKHGPKKLPTEHKFTDSPPPMAKRGEKGKGRCTSVQVCTTEPYAERLRFKQLLCKTTALSKTKWGVLCRCAKAPRDKRTSGQWCPFLVTYFGHAKEVKNKERYDRGLMIQSTPSKNHVVWASMSASKKDKQKGLSALALSPVLIQMVYQ